MADVLTVALGAETSGTAYGMVTCHMGLSEN